MDRLYIELMDIVGEKYVLHKKSDLFPYQHDWCQQFKGNCTLCVKPQNTKQVSQIVKLCRKYNQGLVTAGGRTGLSGGATPINGELVVSLERIQHIKEFCPIQKKVTVGAGLIHANLQSYCKQYNLHWPIDLASSGSCQVGGNLATNAGGIHVIRYGHAKRWCLGMTFVDGLGQIYQTGHHLIKDNSGYDIKQLLIGSEGTLGIVTEATLLLTEQPKELSTLWIALNSIDDILAITKQISKIPCLRPYACELISNKCIQIQNKQQPGQAANFYLLLSLEHLGSGAKKALEKWFSELISYDYFIDATVAYTQQQSEMLWQYREEITASLAALNSPLFKIDVSIPLKNISTYIKDLSKMVIEHLNDTELYLFGHIADGNIHVNLLNNSNYSDIFYQSLTKFNIMHGKYIAKINGSLSAEHGIGLLKKDYLIYMRSKQDINLMKQLKKVFDPNGILNPTKLF